MRSQVLATTVIAAGTLLAGSALAQTQAPTMQQPPMTQPAQSQAGQSQAGQSINARPQWHENRAAEHHAERVGSLYTDALNTLYAHGFHGVHNLRMDNGNVMATAITPRGVQRQVTVQPETHQISIG